MIDRRKLLGLLGLGTVGSIIPKESKAKAEAEVIVSETPEYKPIAQVFNGSSMADISEIWFDNHTRTIVCTDVDGNVVESIRWIK